MKDNKITNRDAKRIFAEFVAWEFIPCIYIDEYWDYYINLYGLNSTWENFLKQFVEEGLTYRTFLDEYNDILIKSGKVFNELCIKQQDLVDQLQYTNNIPKTTITGQAEGDYLYVDMHNAYDYSLKKIGVFDGEYKSTTDIIEANSKYDIFKNIKLLRMDIYNGYLPNKITYVIRKIENQVVLEDLYSSGAPILKQLDETFQIVGKGTMDSFIYKIPEGVEYKSILGDYTYGDMSFHIDLLKSRRIHLFGKQFEVSTVVDKNNSPDHIRLCGDDKVKRKIAPYPFAYKLSLRQELDEKDLAVGYDDQIFFHFDKSDIL